MSEIDKLLGIDNALRGGLNLSAECLPNGQRIVVMEDPQNSKNPCGYGVGRTVEEAVIELNRTLVYGDRYVSATCQRDPLYPVELQNISSSLDRWLWQGGVVLCKPADDGIELKGDWIWEVRFWGNSFLRVVELAFPGTIKFVEEYLRTHPFAPSIVSSTIPARLANTPSLS